MKTPSNVLSDTKQERMSRTEQQDLMRVSNARQGPPRGVPYYTISQPYEGVVA